MKRPSRSKPAEASNACLEQQEPLDFGPARPRVREARDGERRSVVEVIGRAFYDDPVSTFLFPKDESRLRGFARFSELAIDAFGPSALLVTNEGVSGAAIWQRPTPTFLTSFEQISLGFRMAWIAGRRFPRAIRLGELTRKYHPKEPHYYLACLGTDPDHQRQGIGSSLMQPVLDRCDKERTTAYLESSKRENIAFYNKHGFEVTDEIVVPGGPVLWPMIRRTG